MCPKIPKAPIFLIGGICFVIVLVGITGITLINNINLSNIIRLNEKVASDSVSAGDNHMKEIMYANNHPKNVFKAQLKDENSNDSNDPLVISHDPEPIVAKRLRNDLSSLIMELSGDDKNSKPAAGSNEDGYTANTVRRTVEDKNDQKDGDHDHGRAVFEDDRKFSPKIAAVFWSHNNSTAKTESNNVKYDNNNSSSIQRNNNNNSFDTQKFEKESKILTDAKGLITTDFPAAETANKIEIVTESLLAPLRLMDYNVSMIDFGKRQKVVEMMEHSWRNYKLYAWGKNELRPLSQRPHSGSIFGAYDLGATIVDGLDTLYLMGLDKEYKEGREWIERKLWLDNISADLSVFETNIRFVGGLLTLYAFTGDTLYRDRAQHIADKLLPAFQTPTGIPYALVNTRTGSSKNYGWASGGSSILSELGTLHLEFVYLSDITGNPLYRERVQAIRQVLKEIEKPKGLYPNFLNPKTGKWGQMHMSLGALGDSFFEYLLKAWLQSGQADDEARDMFDEAMVAIIEKMVRTSPNGLTYVSDLKFDRLEHKMDHLACFAGGLFALGATTRQNEHTQKFMEIGKGITSTCHESYIRTPTRLGPEAFRFSEAAEARALKSQEKYYILRPETIESYFILWRLTHDQKYRDWGWDAVQALERHCRTPHGYCGIKNVYQEEPQKDDVQQSFFLAETLKYLYLLFSDDSLLPLDEWVFNTEAHPLPIKGANIYYRQAATTSAAAAAASSNVAAP